MTSEYLLHFTITSFTSSIQGNSLETYYFIYLYVYFQIVVVC